MTEKIRQNTQDQNNNQSGTNVDGTPDMRLKENRDDPQKVSEANERKENEALPGDGKNKDGTPDQRLKENR
jgi:hypothetical protein